jgi:DNA-binding MarR family transcriptional regulator
MTPKPMPQTISYLIAQISKAHRGCAGDALAGVGLYPGQEMFLLQLWDHNGMTLSQLAEKMCVQPSTITKMLARMEKAGLVERRMDAEDSRVSRVYLTEQSQYLQNAVEQAWDNLEERTIANFSTEERILLRRLLMQVYENLNAPTEM